jgi:hypothetical protein
VKHTAGKQQHGWANSTAGGIVSRKNRRSHGKFVLSENSRQQAICHFLYACKGLSANNLDKIALTIWVIFGCGE